ncbi:peptidylprolyl isomerase [Citrus sinensis]|uniref:Peptidylprolyl isomerase n=1 Tax=Citrus sinensis TaxID=2711 RepID=A0ACB8JV38_CITSI|nr:peptidylprolyl isomerase [Citrus sinensis]
MAVEDEDINPQKKKAPSEDDKRRMKIVPGSLMKAVMRPGGGDSTPSDGDQVAYHCTVRTLDGVIVESTRSEYGGKGIPIRHVLGKSKILLGLLEGIPTMLKGEVSMFKMKPQMHYGEDDCPVAAPSMKFSEIYIVSGFLLRQVPKGLEMGIGTMTREEKAVIYVTSQYLTPSPLMPVVEGYEEVHFEVELVHLIQVRDMLGDGRLIKRRIRDGKGEFPMDCPLHDSLLRVHYKGMLLNEEKKVFYDTRVDNDGQPLEFSSGEGLVPEGFEMCVRLMLPGEIALVTCPPDYAYDKFLRPANVPEGAHIQWEIELLGFEKPKDWTGLSFDGIMDEAEKIRVTGNRLFKEGKFELAKAKYEKVLDANPAHVKGLYRRGMAYMALGEFEEAQRDFEMMMKVDKSSEPDATAALSKLKKQRQEVESKARKQFKGLFDKKPGEISEVGIENQGEDQAAGKNENDDSEQESDGDEAQEFHEAAAEAPRKGCFYRFWPTSGRLFSALGLDRCTIL